MPNVGTIYLDAKLNSSGLKKQVTQLGKTIGKLNLNVELSKTSIKSQLKNLSKQGLKLKVDVEINKNSIDSALKRIKGKKIKIDVQSNTENMKNNAQNSSKAFNDLSQKVNNVNNSTRNAYQGMNAFYREVEKTVNGINNIQQKGSLVKTLVKDVGGITLVERHIKEVSNDLNKISSMKLAGKNMASYLNEVKNLKKESTDLKGQLDKTFTNTGKLKVYQSMLENVRKQQRALSAAYREARTANDTASQNNIRNTQRQIQAERDLLSATIRTTRERIASSRELIGMSNSIINSLSNVGGSGIISKATQIVSSLGRMIATAIGGPVAGAVTGAVINLLGTIANLMVTAIKGAINIIIKVVKGAVEVIKKMFNFFKELPDTISKAVSKIGQFSVTFRALGAAFNYCNNLAQQFASILGQKFSAYSIVNFVKESLELGSSLTESTHILKVILPEYFSDIQKMGKYTEYMNNVTKDLGISVINATDYLSNYSSMWKSLGIDNNDAIWDMSTKMLHLTSDLSAFKNMDYADVYKSLKSVVFGGQTRTGLNMGVDIYVQSMSKYLENLNITLDESSSELDRYVASLNKNWSALDANAKAAVRLHKVLNDLDYMWGDYSKTAYTYANQVRLIKEQFSNLKATIGENLIMTFNWVLTIINKILGALNQLALAMNSFLKTLGFGWILESKGSISDAISDETDSLNDASESIGEAGSSAAEKIRRSLLPFDKLLNNLTDNDSDSGSSGNSNSDGGFNLIKDEGISEYVEETETLINKAISRLAQSLKKVSSFFSLLWNDFNTYFAKPFGEFLQGENGIPRLINNIADLIDMIEFEKLNTSFRKWFKSLEPVAEFFVNVGLDIQEYFINPLVAFWTNNILTGIIDTLTKFNNAVNWEGVRGGINSILTTLRPVLESIMSLGLWIFSNVLKPIGEWFMNSAFPAISSALSSFFMAISRIWNALSPSLIEFYKEVLVPFGNAIGDKIISKLQDITNYFNGIDTEWIDELKQKLAPLGDDLQVFFDRLSEFDLGGAFDALVQLIKDADAQFGISKALTDMLGKVFDASFGDDGLISKHILPALKELLNQIINSDFVQNDIPSALAKIVEAIAPTIIQVGTLIGKGLITGIKNAFTELKNDTLNYLFGNGGADAFNENKNSLSTFALSTSTLIPKDVIALAETGGKWIGDKITEGFNLAFNNKTTVLYKAGEDAGKTYADGVSNGIAGMNFDLTGRFDNESNKQIASSAGNNVGNQYSNGILGGLDFSPILTASATNINNYMSTQNETLRSTANQAGKSISDAHKDSLLNGINTINDGTVSTTFSNAINMNMSTQNEKIKSTVNNAAKSITTEVDTTLVSAINSSQTTFESAGTRIGSSIFDGIKNKLLNPSLWKYTLNGIGSTISNNSSFMEWTQSRSRSVSSSIARNIPSFANGGYVYPQSGGQIVRVSENGKGEHIVGDDKLRQTIRDEMKNNVNANNSQVPFVIQIGEHEFATFIIDLIKNEVRRTGVSFA